MQKDSLKKGSLHWFINLIKESFANYFEDLVAKDSITEIVSDTFEDSIVGNSCSNSFAKIEVNWWDFIMIVDYYYSWN